MFCQKCGIGLPQEAAFCYRCGAAVVPASPVRDESREVVAPLGVVSLKCPSCGAPLSPRFGEMMLTCLYCGNCVSLGAGGWKNIQKHSMLPLMVRERDVVISKIHSLMNKGVLRWHVYERSSLQELVLSYVPYWILTVSARTSIVAADASAQVASVAATTALLGMAAGASHGRRGRVSPLDAAMLGGVVAGGIGHAGTATVRAYQMNENHNYPVVALRALAEYQPHDFEFALQERELFDVTKIPKGVRVLNGDLGEEDARQQARTLVDQLQSQKAHKKYSMIQQLKTEVEVGEAELLHVPAWLGRYRFRGKKEIVVIIDGNSGEPIHTVGLGED